MSGAARRGRALLPPAGTGRLAAAGLSSSLGAGAYLTFGVIYFTQHLGLPVRDVGQALALAGIVGLATAVPAGRLTDRVGARRATCTGSVVQFAGAVGLWHAQDLATMVLFACVLAVGERGGNVAWQALVAQQVPPDDRTVSMAYLRSVANGGMLVGSAAAALPLALGTDAAFTALFVSWSAALLLPVAVYASMSTPRATVVAPNRGLGNLRDLPYLFVALVCGCMAMGSVVLTVGVPLWLVEETSVSRVAIAWLMGVNTVLVILLQVRASRRADSIAGSVHLIRWAGLLLACSVVVLWASGATGSRASLALLTSAVLLLTMAELFAAASGWTLRFGLADPGRQGEYGAVFLLGDVPRLVLGPLVITAVVASPGGVGWAILAAAFLAVAAIARLVVRHAERTRSHAPVLEPA